MNAIVEGKDGVARCKWASATAEYVRYHDTEWGFPVDDDHRLFEKICLEGFQSGLSWRTILEKRENFRAAFCDFDFDRIAGFGDGDVERLLGDSGIVRHRGKIEATINNARRATELAGEFGSLASYFWSFEPETRLWDGTDMPSSTPGSTALSKDLKRRGWRFVGPTTAYAFMQAMGLVNDHAPGCAAREHVEKARTRFRPPQPR